MHYIFFFDLKYVTGVLEETRLEDLSCWINALKQFVRVNFISLGVDNWVDHVFVVAEIVHEFLKMVTHEDKARFVDIRH